VWATSSRKSIPPSFPPSLHPSGVDDFDMVNFFAKIVGGVQLFVEAS